jgi:hypothetical protein
MNRRRDVTNSSSHIMINDNVIMVAGLWILWSSFDFFCRQFLWQMRQFHQRLFIRLLLQWHKFIRLLHRLPMWDSSISALLPTTLTLLTLLLHDALFSSKEHSLKLRSKLFYVYYKIIVVKSNFSHEIFQSGLSLMLSVTHILE